jgi:two-component system phosphate regulon response regulator OmpR
MTDRILMIEDDASLTTMVGDYLDAFAMQVTCAASIEEGRAWLSTGRFDAVLLDVMLPDGDGFDLCREIRASSVIPVLMLTGRGEDTDRIVGLELGADDYLPKPFNPRELVARLRAILRRRHSTNISGDRILNFGNIEIDRDALVKFVESI